MVDRKRDAVELGGLADFFEAEVSTSGFGDKVRWGNEIGSKFRFTAAEASGTGGQKGEGIERVWMEI